jgi:hypothetical protein
MRQFRSLTVPIADPESRRSFTLATDTRGRAAISMMAPTCDGTALC